MLEIKQLKYFMVCAREGSFSSAAEVLYTTQPNVSRVIKDLEKELGFAVFKRKGRGIVLTDEGEHIKYMAENILKSTDMLKSVSEYVRHDFFCVASMPDEVSRGVFTRMCERYKDKGVMLKYIEGDVEFVVRRVEEHASEIGIVYVPIKLLPDFNYMLYSKEMKMTQICTAGVAVSFGSGSEFRGKKTVRVRELAAKRLVKDADDSFSIESLILGTSDGAKLQSAIDAAVVTGSEKLVQTLLTTNAGMCRLCVRTVGEPSAQGEIETRPIEGLENSVAMGIVTRGREQISEVSEKYITELVKSYRGSVPEAKIVNE